MPDEPEQNEEQQAIACCHHPDVAATHNCMGCGQPLCMDCVRTSGYYCSEECKASVQATEPDAVTEADRESSVAEQRVEETMAAAGSFARLLKWPIIFILIGVVAWFGYRAFFGPKGTVTSKIEMNVPINSFHVEHVAPDLMLVQDQQKLALIRPSKNETIWSVDRQQFASAASEEDGAGYDTTAGVAALNDSIVVLRGPHKLVALDRSTGTTRWQHDEPKGYLGDIHLADDRVVLAAGNKVICLASHDGSSLWNSTNSTIAGQLAGNRIVSVETPGGRRFAGAASPAENGADGASPSNETPTATGGEEEYVPTAGPAEQFSAKNLLGLAKGETPAAPTAPYIVRFQSIADVAQQTETRRGYSQYPTVTVIGQRVYVFGGPQLDAFNQDGHLVWESQLPEPIESIAGGESAVAVSTPNGVTVFDASNGSQRWSRKDLTPMSITVAPDGSTYITTHLDKEAAKAYTARPISSRRFSRRVS